MKTKYLLFAYREYYPKGGMEDCILVADSLEELMDYALCYMIENADDFDCMSYFDCQTNKTYTVNFDKTDIAHKFISWELYV